MFMANPGFQDFNANNVLKSCVPREQWRRSAEGAVIGVLNFIIIILDNLTTSRLEC